MKGPEFLKKQYQKLHTSKEVKGAVERKEKKEGEKVSQKPVDRIQVYLERFSEVVQREDEKKRERGVRAVKKVLFDRYVMTPETIPDSHFEREKRRIRELGRGETELSEEQKAHLSEVVIQEQEKSLEKWIEYLSGEEAGYPDWFVYFAFRGMLTLGVYDKEKRTFSKRTKETTAPYAPLNREALALTLDTLTEEPSSPEGFATLYAQALERAAPETDYDPEGITGTWKTYEQNSDPTLLSSSLENHATGWCIAGETTAGSYLTKGDVQVYYSDNHEGSPTIPRLAIVEQEEHITEVRGVAPGQHVDSHIQPVLDEELKRRGDKGRDYLKASADMKYVTALQKKNPEDFTKEDLRFLYEIATPIKAFGYGEDPRVEELLETRDKRKDLATIFNCREDQISFTEKEALSGDIVYHYGDLFPPYLTTAEGLRLPKYVEGSLDLNGLTTAEGLQLPEHVGESLNLSGLTTAEGLHLPERVGGDIYLDSLATAEGLQLPEHMEGNLNLNSLTSAEGLRLPERVGGSLDLDGLTTAEGLHLPKYVGGILALNSLTSAEGLYLPERVGGILDLDGLTTAEGLYLPERVEGSLNLGGLTTAEGLQLPERVGGSLDLGGLTTAEGLQLPEHVGEGLFLNSLTTAKGLQLPEHMGGDVYLDSLTTAEGLWLPKYVGGDLDLRGLTSAEGLRLPEHVGGILALNSLTSAEGLRLPEHVGGILDLDGLTTAEGLYLPKRVEGSLNLGGLTTAKGLQLPEHMGGILNLSGLTTAEELHLPEHVKGDVYLDSLTTAEGLRLPKYVEGNLNLSGLTTAEGLYLPERVEGDLDLRGLTTVEGLQLPEYIEGSLHLNRHCRKDNLEEKNLGISITYW